MQPAQSLTTSNKLVLVCGMSAVMAGIVAMVSESRLWEEIPKLLPNGETDFYWIQRRVGPDWIWIREPRMIRVPRELSEVNRKFWEQISDVSSWIFLGSVALTIGSIIVSFSK